MVAYGIVRDIYMHIYIYIYMQYQKECRIINFRESEIGRLNYRMSFKSNGRFVSMVAKATVKFQKVN